MPSAYSSVVFKNSPLGITANKLNQLVDDLSAAIAAGGGGGGTGTGDMTKAVYDTNDNGIVDTADSIPWSKVTGKPSALGDMTKAVYDINNDGISDHAALADAAPWTGITGKPATYPPDSTAMLKATYDVNGDGITDHAALADSAPWAGISGKPATFPATAHATTHLDNGTDIIPVVTAIRTGLVPKLSNDATTYLNGAGAYTKPVGNGDMLKSVYDINGDNIVDHAALADTATSATTAAAVPWTGVTGKPSTFPPDSTAMLKSVYDTNGNGVVDTADAIPWTSVTGKPTGNLVDPGTWASLSLGTGWTAPTQAQYRVEVNGAVSTVYFRGMIQAAYSALGTTAFTAPAGARPSMTRSLVLGGAQNTGTASDIASYLASVSSVGVCTVYFLCAAAFTWADPSQVQQVYLDSLFYSL
jgi:hypothetical protein